MSNNGRLRTIRVPVRKICAALPAVALISGGIVFSASAAPVVDRTPSSAAASSAPAIIVPDIALTWPPASGPAGDASRLVGPRAPGAESLAGTPLPTMLPAGTIPGSPSLVTLDSTGIPVRALEGYRQAATLTDSADPTCNIDWALLAAIGRVESNHARFGGNHLDSAGVAQPGIIGIALDGSGATARITDSDGGLLDRDRVFDRAVGPMQFIPSTWRFSGVDADGDGVRNPQDIADASTASAVYLCSGPGDLTDPDALRSAVLRYNASDSYVQMVTNIASAYRLGVRALPASDLTPATVVRSARNAATAGPVRAVSGSPGQASPTSRAPTGASPAAGPTTAVPTRPLPTTAVPTTTTPTIVVPTTALPTTALPTTAVPTTALPTTALPTTALPTTAVPTTTTPTTAVPATTATCLPAPTTTDANPTAPATPVPCLPEPCVASTDPTAPATTCPAPIVATLPSAPGSTP